MSQPLENYYRPCVYSSFKSVYKTLSEPLAQSVTIYSGPTRCLAQPSPFIKLFETWECLHMGLVLVISFYN